MQNQGKSTEEVLGNQNYPVVMITDYLVKQGDDTNVVFLSKVKLMGWEKDRGVPRILDKSEVPVISGGGEIVWKSREGLEQFDVPAIEISDESETMERTKSELNADYDVICNKKQISLMDAVSARSLKEKT